jgi:tRNA(Ile)-lysidine synthase
VTIVITDDQDAVINGQQRLHFSRVPSTMPINASRGTAFLDLAKISFPVIWRTWDVGDSFSPLGMTTHKKISDFLIDLKVPLIDKEAVTVLESNGEILWVVGFRISEKAKVTAATSQILRIEWQRVVASPA